VGCPSVSVILLNYNGLRFLEPCLESLKRTRYSNFRVILVDNGSTDGSQEFVRARYPDFVTPVFNRENLGFSKAMNQVLQREELCGKYVVLLNNDTEPQQHWLEELVKVAESDSSVGALQPRLLSLRDPRYFDYNGAAGGYLDRYGYTVCRGRIFYSIEQDNGQYDDMLETLWAGGPAIFLRHDILSDTGYLDEDFWAYFEEIDLCWRIRLRGYKVLCVPSSVVYHYWGGANTPRVQYFNHRNNLLTLIKNYSWLHVLRYVPGRAILDLANVGYALSKGDLRWAMAIVSAHVWILLHLPLVLRRRREVQRLRRVPDAEIMRLMLRHSVVLQFFLQGRRDFSTLSGLPSVVQASQGTGS